MNWHLLEIGGGWVEQSGDSRILLNLPAIRSGYADAQIDDTQGLQRKYFRWKPPVHLYVKARTNLTSPLGTLGFGFWNDPFSLSLGQAGTARKLPAAPQAVWYFYGSKPNDIRLSADSPGPGWKAMVLRSPQLPGLLSLALGAIGIGLAQLPLCRRPIMRAAQGVIQAREELLALEMNDWHTYEIFWSIDGVRFLIDDAEILSVPFAPPGPLGFVAWIDNQYALASPDGGIRFGHLPTELTQELELSVLQIKSID
jgi:hypothetical protein